MSVLELFRPAYIASRLENELRRRRGAEFQALFTSIMERRYPGGDFIPVRPWGKIGDKKNDGYRYATRQLFQVYAPQELTEVQARAKIKADFRGALDHWEGWVSEWVLVHNSFDGLPPHFLEEYLALHKNQPECRMAIWAPSDLMSLAKELSDESLTDLLGPIPAPNAVLSVTFEDLGPVLTAIERLPVPAGQDLHPVPKDKIESNGLSHDVASLLTVGMARAAEVRRLIESWPDPRMGEEIAEAFRRRYKNLKDQGLPPDAIFGELLRFCGGASRGTPAHEAAALVVLAYLFESCDIFERVTAS